MPWAGLSGYAENEETAVSLASARVKVDDFELNVLGFAVNFRDRVEMSWAQQQFSVDDSAIAIEQNVLGAKIRVLGDLVYGNSPQLSAGIQYKTLLDAAVAKAIGAVDTDSGTDIYFAASKLHLGLLAGYNTLWNITVRATKANQTGFLGYGGDKDDGYQPMIEASTAIFFNPRFALGIEYRQKPDNVSTLAEEAWKDIFIAYFPNKNFNLTLAWVDLGVIVGKRQQQGLYCSLTGYIF